MMLSSILFPSKTGFQDTHSIRVFQPFRVRWWFSVCEKTFTVPPQLICFNGTQSRYLELPLNHRKPENSNLLLTEREGRTREYWPEVVAVRTERSDVRTTTTEGQYSLVRLELARLVSRLLYGWLWPGLFWIFRLSKTKNTQLMTVSTETVRMAKSRPGKNQSERSDLPCQIIRV